MWTAAIPCKVDLIANAECGLQQCHAIGSEGRVSSDDCTCRHREMGVSYPTPYLTRSQHTVTGPTSPRTDAVTDCGAEKKSFKWYLQVNSRCIKMAARAEIDDHTLPHALHDYTMHLVCSIQCPCFLLTPFLTKSIQLSYFPYIKECGLPISVSCPVYTNDNKERLRLV